MHLKDVQCIASPILISIFLMASAVGKANADTEDLARGHTQFTSVVTKKAGALVVMTPNGATHQLNENMARRHGQEPFKAGVKSSWCWMKTTTSSICISRAWQANINW